MLLAVQNAVQGKPPTQERNHFSFFQEKEILRLQAEIRNKTYRHGMYRTFRIFEPKERYISTAPFRDRVVHHALCQVINPIFEPTFIFDSYANRIGKGTHGGIERYQYFAKQYPYVLKCDIQKFFPSLDHAVLKAAFRKKIKCKDTLWLCDHILDNSNPQEPTWDYFGDDDLFSPLQHRRGLPIGNLTSQFWANVYMNAFDHFVKEEMRVKGYIRYVDDFVLFAKSKEELQLYRAEITRFLDKLRLKLHPNKTQIYRVQDGVPFLGFRVYPYYRYVLKQNAKRYKRHLKTKIKHYKAHKITPNELEAALNSYLGHIRFGQSQRLEKNIFRMLREADIPVFRHPKGSWRVLEYRP